MSERYVRTVLIICAVICSLCILWFTFSAYTRPHIFEDPAFDRLAAFAALSILLASAFPNHLMRVLAFAVAAAIATELLQFLRPTRDPRLIDGEMKVIGSFLGIAFFGLVRVLFRKR